MEVICLEEPAFYQLLEKVVARLKDQQMIHEEPWLSTEEAMEKLKISSKIRLSKFAITGSCVEIPESLTTHSGVASR
jgi:hypothetical protein